MLKTPLVEYLIDKQSVPNTRTNFSLDVEEWMVENEYTESAKLTRLIRQWYEASDQSGMRAIERVKHLMEMRQFVLEDVDFGIFPPFGRYIKGIPIVTFEEMLVDIDLKLQMYAIVGDWKPCCRNHRRCLTILISNKSGLH